MILVMSRSIAQGAAAGVSVGPVGHTLLATRGLGAGLRVRPAALAWLYRGSGLVLIGLAFKLALERRR